MDLREIRRRGRTAFKANMLVCIGAALVAALLVKGSISMSGNSYSALAYINTGTEASTESTGSVQAVADGSETAAETEGTEVQNSGTGSTGLTETAETTGSTETAQTTDTTASSDYTNRDIIIYIVTDESMRLMGAILPAGLGMFFNMMARSNGIFAMLVALLVSNVLEVGMCRFFLINTMRKAYMNELLWPFKEKRFWRMMMIQLYRMCWICLFGMLLIVPGIIKALEMRAVPYLLTENPNMKMEEAFQKSKEMMMGHKKEAFLLDLSFFWWDCLSVLTMGISGTIWSNPYKMASQAEFYSALRGGELKIDGARGGAGRPSAPKGAFDGYHSYQKKNK